MMETEYDGSCSPTPSRRVVSGATSKPLIPLILYWFNLTAATVLVLLVLIAPLLDNGERSHQGGRQAIALFARDPATRRVSLASAVGLVVTACVFFWPATRRGVPRPSRASSNRVIGA